MKKIMMILALIAILCLGIWACGNNDDDEDEKECPRFYSFQVYPEQGSINDTFELLVVLRNHSDNEGVAQIEASARNADGSYAGKTYDLVQSSSDPLRFLRSFQGNEVCNDARCAIYFEVVATHISDCEDGFDTEVIVIGQDTVDDDDDNDDNDNNDTTGE